MSVFSSIKNWLKKSFGGGTSTAKKPRVTAASYYGGGGSRTVANYNQPTRKRLEDEEERRRKEAEARRKELTESLASISKRTDNLSSGKADVKTASRVNPTTGMVNSGKSRALDKLRDKAQASKETGERAKANDPKQNAAEQSRERARERLKKVDDWARGVASKTAKDDKLYQAEQQFKQKQKTRADAFNKATDDRYNFNTGDKQHDQEAWARVMMNPMRAQMEDPDSMEFAMKEHPKFWSAMQGAGNGATFGLRNFAAALDTDEKRRESEAIYQANKNPWAEMGGELVGSMAAFGATGGATDELGAKLASKLPGVTNWLADTRVIQGAAQRAANRAVKKGLIGEASEFLVKQMGKEKAAQIMAVLGGDLVQNLTTGGLYDVITASTDYEPFSPEWWRALGQSAEFNLAATGLLAGGKMLSGGKKLAVNTARELGELGGDALKSLPNIKAPEVEAPRVEAPQAANVTKDLAPIIDEAAPPRAEVEPPRVEVEPPRMERVEPPRPETVEPPRLETVEPPRAETVAPPKPERVEPPKVNADEFPYEGTPEAREMRSKIKEGKRKAAESYASDRAALEGRTRELETEVPLHPDDEPLRVNNVAENKPLGEMTEGVRKARSLYASQTGEEIAEGTRTTFDEAWEASREYHASHATGAENRLSKTSVTQLHAMDSDAERQLAKQLRESGDLSYNAIHTDEMLENVSKKFHADPKRWVNDMIDINNGKALDFRATPEWQAMGHYIMAVVDPSADAASEAAYTEAYKLVTSMSSKAGQTNNLRRQFVHLTPAGRRDSIVSEMADILYNSQGFRNAHPDMPTSKYDSIAYIKAFLEDDPKIKELTEKLVAAGSNAQDIELGAETVAKAGNNLDVSEMAQAEGGIPLEETKTKAKPKGKAKGKGSKADAITAAHAELMTALNEKNPKTGFDVLQEIRYLNMLGNPRTHIRNIFGSGFFAPIRQVSNAIRGTIEDSVIKSTGLDITRHGGLSWNAIADAWAKEPTSEAGKAALEAFEEAKPELLGSMKLDNQLYEGRAKTKVGKILDKVSDFNSHLLSGEDDFFKERAFRENYIKSYEAYVKKGTPMTKKIKEQIAAEAFEEAQIATFNEYNSFANWLASITKKASDPNASTLGRWAGRGVNAMMPFTKVPSNIMKQSVNYSPIGIVKGFSDIKVGIKAKDVSKVNRAIDELASGLTGTGLFGLGMLLGTTSDRFTTNAGKNDAAAKFKKAQGTQNYSVTLDIGDNKYSVTLDWLVPNSATFFAGVEMANQLRSGDFNILDIGGDWAQVMTRLVEPVLETSMLSGLYSVLETTRNGYGDDDKQSALSIMIREIAQSYLSSLAPTALGQIARTVYSSDKQVSGTTDWEYFKNQTKSKIGLGGDNAVTRKFGIEPLGADTDAYGNVKGKKEDAGDYVKSALKNFLSPANIQKVDLDETDMALIKQYEDAVKDGADPQEMSYLFPKKQYNKQFTVGDMDIKMSNTDLSTYNQAKTTGGAEGIRYLVDNSIIFNRPVVGADGKKVPGKDALTDAQKEQLIKEFDGKSMRDVQKWLYSQPQFQKASEEEKRKAINGLWSLTGQGKAQGAKRVGEQAVFKAQGKDVNEYNFKNELTDKKQSALLPYIEAGILTYEEAVDFARNAGKTYYYENDEGGSANTYFNKKEMMEYLQSKGYSYEKAEALFNAFKNGNAKPYDGKMTSSRGGRRGGYYRRRSGGGGRSGKAKVPAPKKMGKLESGQALVSKSSRSSSKSKTAAPTLKRVQAKVDLPTVRK